MKYPWKRFWCPRDGEMNLSDAGFLYDPDSKHAEWIQPDVVPFEKIAHRPCLALLGEPGIGKTTAMEELGASLKGAIHSSGDCLLYMNLNEYGDESRLIADLFSCEKFVKWKQGNYLLHLFLDSLDECGIRIPQVATILINRFRGTFDLLSRLRLRISCRTADWPSTLEQSLPQLWGEDNFGAYELCPLRLKDVKEALRVEGIDAVKFMAEMERTESVPLALKPATLRFLVSIFRSDGELPLTRTELYEKGCELLCAELNLNRQDLRSVGGAGVLSSQQRFTIACRIAATCMFCGKPTIFTGTPIATQNAEQMAVSKLDGVEVASTTKQWDVSEAHITEALGTGLFSSRGADLMGFAHQTYAEFLASQYLRLHNVPAKKMLALLRHSGDFESHIVPQLYETAAWVASQDEEVFSAIARDEPHVLLRCDQGALSLEQRAEIVDSFLEALNERRANDRDRSLYRNYAKLQQAGLAEQLRPWIVDSNKQIMARDAAIDIAQVCSVRDLQSILADVALNNAEPELLRSAAAGALAKVGDSEARMRLRPLALGQTGADPYDQLKGNALRAIWPDLITAEELFGHLTMPKRENFFGTYRNFVEHELSDHLGASHLPDALKWLESHAQHSRLGFPFRLLANGIIIRAWKHMDDPQVLGALANTSIELMKHHHDLVVEAEERNEHASLFDDVTKRQKLAKAIIEEGLDGQNAFLLVGGWNSPRLLGDGDFEWCVEQLISSISHSTESTWAQLVWTLFTWAEPSGWMLDVFVDAREKSTKLKEESASFFTPVVLGSEQAKEMLNQYEQSQRWQQKKVPKLLEWLPKDRIQHQLRLFEQGKQDAWWVLLRELTLEDTSERYEHVFHADMRELPGWVNSDEKTRTRILDAAETYLKSKCSFSQTRLLDDSADEQDVAGYKAFLLLMNERPDDLASLSESIWAYWTPIFFGPFGYNGNREVQKLLISLAYEKTPENVAERLIEIIRHQIGKEERHVSVLDLVESIWDQRIASAVFSMLEKAQVKPGCWGHILHVLLGRGHDGASSLAENKLSLPLAEAEDDRSIALQAGLVMMNLRDDASWPLIWPILQAEVEFGRDLIKEFAHGLHHDPSELVSKLTEASVADLFIWLVQQFPYDTDTEYDGVHSPTKEDAARELRTRLLNFLEKAGTPASCQAIQRIAQTLTELDWLQTVFIEARKNTLQSTWRPLQPTEFLQITSQPESVLVRDAAELQEVLVEALGGLEILLQGKYAAPDLWDQQIKGSFRPKDENHFSDWIARNLELELNRRGIVVAREVQIRRGERTDIHITAVIPGLTEGSYEQARVIVEAKGCWHRELKSAMKSQLVDRYLKDYECDHGIYLVGWYACDQWEESDRRKSATPKLSLQEATRFFEEQAQGFSSSATSIKAVVLNTALR